METGTPILTWAGALVFIAFIATVLYGIVRGLA